MNKTVTSMLLTSALLCISLPASAVMEQSHGVYAGINMGYSKVFEKIPDSTLNQTGGLGGRVEVGYKFNKTFATEVGFAMLRDEQFDNNIKAINNYIIDIAIKAILPFKNGFTVFGKIGPAAYNHKYTGAMVIPGRRWGSHFKPTIFGAIGAGYSFTPNISVTAQLSGTIKYGVNNPATALAAIGVTYIIPTSLVS